MAYNNGALDAILAAAAGDNAKLMRELRAAFLDSAASQLDLLKRARHVARVKCILGDSVRQQCALDGAVGPLV